MKKTVRWLPLAAATLMLAGCFEITKVDQPAAVKSGEPFSVTMEVKTDGTDENAHHGIVAFKVPNDWKVKKVSMKGDYGRGELKYLPPDLSDLDVGGKVDYWEPALERIFPSGDSMKWVVYQTPRAYKATKDIAFQTIVIDFVAGAGGEYAVDYLATEAALDFDSPDYYGLKQGVKISVE